MIDKRVTVELNNVDVGFQKDHPIHVTMGSVGASLTVVQALDLAAQVTEVVLEHMAKEDK